MAKRFTESAKWADPWFRGLEPSHKFAWLYLLDNCDTAGVIDLDKPLAEFQIGMKVHWHEFLEACDGRVAELECGKWWIVGFIKFQVGEISEECRAHKPIIKSLEKHNLSELYQKGIDRVSIPSLGTVQDKDKDKDKEKDKGGVGGKEPHDRSSAESQIPAKFSLVIREKLIEWLRYKREIGDRYKPTGLQAFFGKVANAVRDYGESQVIASIDDSMANGWKGWNHSLGKARGSPEPIDRREAEILKATREMEARNGPRQPQPSDQHLLCDHRGPDP